MKVDTEDLRKYINDYECLPLLPVGRKMMLALLDERDKMLERLKAAEAVIEATFPIMIWFEEYDDDAPVQRFQVIDGEGIERPVSDAYRKMRDAFSDYCKLKEAHPDA